MEKKQEILKNALLARQQEVMHYQINIDNYTIALQKIADLPLQEQSELSEFSEQLRALLFSELLEQKKSKIMLEVIKQQVE